MTPRELRDAVRGLRDAAFQLRQRREAIVYKSPSVPVATTRVMRDAAQALDDAANALLEEHGEDLPDGVL